MEKQPLDWELLRKHLEQTAAGTFWDDIGAKVLQIVETRTVAGLIIDKRHLNHLGIVHGGIHATLLDSVMGIAAMVARPYEKLVTTNLNVHYLSPVTEGELRVSAEVIHQTPNVITTQGKVMTVEGDTLALGTGSFRVKMQKGR